MRKYVAVLKHSATDCKFNKTMCLEQPWDCLASRESDKKMMSDLWKLKLKELTFEIIVAKCIAIEQSDKDIHVLQGGKSQSQTL